MARRTRSARSPVEAAPAPGYTFTIRAQYPNTPGMLGRIASTIGAHGGDMGAIDIVESARDRIIRDFTVAALNDGVAHEVVEAVRAVEGVEILQILDRVFLTHTGGKIEIHNKTSVSTRRDLSVVYTPGVARVCRAIVRDPDAVWSLTMRRNAVAVVTDGRAVLGLGDIGPEAALPVMEGKSMLFKAFADVDAWPICLDTKDPDEIVETVKRIAPGFGGINLEDISAPRCFEIEERLRNELDIPVFHDDQHGTAVVVLAAAINALKIVDKRPQDIRVVLSGVGAAGRACAKILLAWGVRDIVGVDEHGIVYAGREAGRGDASKDWFAANTNPRDVRGGMAEATKGADLFIGVSVPNVLTAAHIQGMARDPIVFAMANPDPEIMPEAALPHVRVMATGRSDYPNQINNVLCFPGLFRGVLDARASAINEEMKLAAAHAIAGNVNKNELNEEYIIPSVFNRTVFRDVAKAVAAAATKTGVAQRSRKRDYSGSIF
jgi:malate dehydrogenase (oxaloacetate-decarboxylating)